MRKFIFLNRIIPLVDPLSLWKSNRKPGSKKLIAHVSAIFLLPVFEKSVIFNDFRAIAQSISAREGGNKVCWQGMNGKRTVDDSVTYCSPLKRPMARRRWLEFGVLDQTRRKWARRLGPTGLAAGSSFRHKTTISKHRLGPSGLAICLIRCLCTKTQPKCGLGPAGLAFGASQRHRAPIFRPLDVRLAV